MFVPLEPSVECERAITRVCEVVVQRARRGNAFVRHQTKSVAMEIISLTEPGVENALNDLAQSKSPYDARFARHLLELIDALKK